MSTLLLVLALSLGCFRGTQMAEQDSNHNSIYLTSNNAKMISENGPLRIYLRRVDSLHHGDLNITFYIKVNCTCQKFTRQATRTEDFWYSMTYWGKNYFLVNMNQVGLVTFFLINVSEDGHVTSVLLAVGEGSTPDLTPTHYSSYKERVRKLRLPLKNVIKVTETDTCPHKT